ncbi:MAG TPA: GatB/YqeY domain-containing protein [Candidatus Marinimicrobia bacterium]|nr:GatB/YqeY domain-containing protein [Candidatus Neomarinimicrobiota bacterium]
MSYLSKLQDDLKLAMKSREALRIRTIRSLISKLKEKRIELIHDLEEAEELQVLRKAAKEREESAATYHNAGRDDLAVNENAELEVIKSYLPAEMDDEQISDILKTVIAEIGASSIKDMGKVMGIAMKKLSGQADGKKVQSLVKSMLGA